jgi:hypothetical protein
MNKRCVASIYNVNPRNKMCEYCCSSDLSYIVYYDAYQGYRIIDIVCNHCNLIVERVGVSI